MTINYTSRGRPDTLQTLAHDVQVGDVILPLVDYGKVANKQDGRHIMLTFDNGNMVAVAPTMRMTRLTHDEAINHDNT